jgi:hypothetical protein
MVFEIPSARAAGKTIRHVSNPLVAPSPRTIPAHRLRGHPFRNTRFQETTVDDRMYPGRPMRRSRGPARGPCTFWLDAALVERARREVGEPDMIRSIEAALLAAVDYRDWVREVTAGQRNPAA